MSFSVSRGIYSEKGSWSENFSDERWTAIFNKLQIHCPNRSKILKIYFAEINRVAQKKKTETLDWPREDLRAPFLKKEMRFEKIKNCQNCAENLTWGEILAFLGNYSDELIF